ncbi:MAG: hypothetical protein H6819_09230 [Phycisphaerales bacterium]|nr:hypothetical protein [Phycisphaerales bacterium]MCB9855990.1 hypothetical protein [Phycisphaerales bacterium]MCB9864983.1 hypothetical protein [Phycisphaerales bacterium]
MAQTPEHFDTQLAALLDKLSRLPPEQQAKLQPLVDATRARQRALETDVAAAHDALADWRISMKYAIFAKEAADRERKN